MIEAAYCKIRLKFKETAITSRDRMQYKDTYIVKVYDTEKPENCGVGECALFRGLSQEDSPDYERILVETCKHPLELPNISSVHFGFESAILDLKTGSKQLLYDNAFTRSAESLTINGLIWMGDKRTMKRRIKAKLQNGFSCVKLKIGGINFEEELDLLKSIRKEFTPDEIEIRVDANGAFSAGNALSKLDQLSKYTIHSIEQPIRPGQWEIMERLCRQSPIPIALDEELIGFNTDEYKRELLDTIRPHYIILKPSLCGGFREADAWINEAEGRQIKWWATSALESNIGLNAIAQWVSQYQPTMPQGLGTGALYEANFQNHLLLCGERLSFSNTHISSASVWQRAKELSKIPNRSAITEEESSRSFKDYS